MISVKYDKLKESTNFRKKINVARIPIKAVRAEEAKTMISSTAAGQLVSGFPPLPKQNDLTFHGGKLIPDLSFFNFYVGKSNDSWNQDDKNSIDSALDCSHVRQEP